MPSRFFPDVESGASRGPRGRGRVERARRPVRGGDGGDRSGRGRGRVDTGVARTRTRRSVRRRSRRDWRFARATSRFVRAGGRAGSVAVEGAVEDARSRFRAGVVVAVRLRRADDVGVFLLGERGVGARGWEFRAGGWSRGLAGPRRRGRGRAAGGEADGASRGCTRESWIRDSGVAFGRVVAGDGGREDRHGARARVSDGSFPRGCPTAREWTRAERESNGAGREIATPTRARS